MSDASGRPPKARTTGARLGAFVPREQRAAVADSVHSTPFQPAGSDNSAHLRPGLNELDASEHADDDGADWDAEDNSDDQTSAPQAGSGPRGAARFVPGLQPVREALRAGTQLDKIFVLERPSREQDALARFATDRGVLVEYVSRARLDSMTRGGRHQGVLALAKPFTLHSVDDLELGPDTLGMALDELEDPQNFGAIIRSTVALGGHFVLWPEHHAAPLSMATVRASAGAIEHARLCRVPKLPAALHDLRKRGVAVIGLDMSGEGMLADCTLVGPVVLVIGAEGKGLRRPVKDACSVVAKLPMTAAIASLNASVAAGIALYEVGRQRALASASKA